jgi:ATP-dependent Clp protease adaptor protein ClpS
MSALTRVAPEIEEAEDTKQEESLEPLFRILVHNDDVTPFDFVISVLMRFFQLDSGDAERVTWTAHNSGMALVAVLPLKEAQRRVGRAHFAATLEGYPLTFTIEPA